MSKSDTGLIIFASLLIAAILVSYFVKSKEVEFTDPFIKGTVAPSQQFPQVVRIDNDNYATWKRPVLPKQLKNAHQDNKDLIRHIQKKWILPPPSRSTKRLLHPETYDHSEFGQSFVVDKIMKGMDGGFYVDTWAGNGESNSNSLFLEKDRHWTGLLIEPHPLNFAKLIMKKRQAFTLNACVSPTTTPSILNMTYGSAFQQSSINIQCFPLYSILAAISISNVDYLSLKTEGMETGILTSLPLSELDIKVISIETIVDKDKRATNKKVETVQEILEPYKYQKIDAGPKINKQDTIMSKVAL